MHVMAKSSPGLRDYPGVGFWPLAASTITFVELCVPIYKSMTYVASQFSRRVAAVFNHRHSHALVGWHSRTRALHNGN